MHNSFDSKINLNEKLIISWLNNRNFNSELLFRKTRDGSSPKDFHKKCDKKGTTIIFIETLKGYKFVGYTELEWDINSGVQKDNSTFLFSFNNKEKYTSANNYGNNFSICCEPKKNPFLRNEEPDISFNDILDKVKLYGDYCFNSFFLGLEI